MRDTLDQLLPAGYRRLPADAGLHLTVTGPRDPGDPDLERILRQHDLYVSSLRRTYAFSPTRTGFLLGFAGLPNSLIRPAIGALTSILAGD